MAKRRPETPDCPSVVPSGPNCDSDYDNGNDDEEKQLEHEHEQQHDE